MPARSQENSCRQAKKSYRTPQHPLDGAHLKVVRAQEHIDTLGAELRAYLDSEPYRIVAEKQGDFWRAVAKVRIEPPVHLACTIGDLVTNARAALDYIAWELAVRYLQNPAFDPVDDKVWVSFPLTIDPANAGYVNKINRFTNRRLPTDALKEIDALQPYNAGYEPLWWLHELVNTDKHRVPLLTIGVADPIFSAILAPEGVTGEFTDATPNASPKVAMLIGIIGSDMGMFRPHVKVDGQLTGYVAFEDVSMPREPVERTLEQIIKTVANVIPRFDRFFT